MNNNLIAKEKEYGAQNYDTFSLVLDKAKGSLVWDIDNNEYIDMFAGFSATNLGHGHPRILKALQEQAAKLSVTSRNYYNTVLPNFFDELSQVVSVPYPVVLPMNTGAEAVETAIKIAKKW